MILAAHRPYFAPFAGFFVKALWADVLVLMDSVQFPLGTTWLTRNRLKNDQGTLWMTIPVWKKGLGLQRIRDVKICHEGRWARKHWASLQAAYGKAPYWEDHRTFLEGVFSGPHEGLIQLNREIIHYLLEQFRIPVKVQWLSELDIEWAEPRLSVDMARRLGASQFIAQRSAKKFLDGEAFGKEGIELIFINPRPAVYPQLWGPFIPNLSALDLLMNCGPKSREILRKAWNIKDGGMGRRGTDHDGV